MRCTPYYILLLLLLLLLLLSLLLLLFLLLLLILLLLLLLLLFIFNHQDHVCILLSIHIFNHFFFLKQISTRLQYIQGIHFSLSLGLMDSWTADTLPMVHSSMKTSILQRKGHFCRSFSDICYGSNLAIKSFHKRYREREREREREHKSEKERERESECVSGWKREREREIDRNKKHHQLQQKKTKTINKAKKKEMITSRIGWTLEFSCAINFIYIYIYIYIYIKIVYACHYSTWWGRGRPNTV